MTKDLFGDQPETQPPDAKPAGEKRARGAYFTNDALALAICRSLYSEFGIYPGSVFEPGCGGGAFLRAAHQTWPAAQLLGVDLVPCCEGPGRVETRDLFETRGSFDLSVGNPDFGIAERVARHCMGQLTPRGWLALLLRLSFHESAERVPLFTDFPLRAFQPVAQRQTFTGDGATDKVGLGVFVWQDGFRGRGELLPPLLWR